MLSPARRPRNGTWLWIPIESAQRLRLRTAVLPRMDLGVPSGRHICKPALTGPYVASGCRQPIEMQSVVAKSCPFPILFSVKVLHHANKQAWSGYCSFARQQHAQASSPRLHHPDSITQTSSLSANVRTRLQSTRCQKRTTSVPVGCPVVHDASFLSSCQGRCLR